ncbi:hypothetical protein B0I35DRAFT_455154 [Stachybotrys elegans]|uniref:Uncharacterized protein n=1 Tax=Stachybotrys elegans TaxID=80388 RepID=A0A8K0SD93_9HYPO|nr:hypothetical protein B0I35DRAFT_455154 [Stachybotrys elegans]
MSKRYITHDQNSAELLKICQEFRNNGLLAGWKMFSELLPQWGIHPQMVSDGLRSVQVYQSVKGIDKTGRSTSLRMTVKPSPGGRCLTEIGPKSIGGQTWKSNQAYIEFIKTWNGLGQFALPPCPIWIWITLMKKVVAEEHHDDAGAIHMISSVDYDFDRNPVTKAGFEKAIEISARCVTSTDVSLRGAALAALFSFDIQKLAWETQEEWLQLNEGSFTLGPSDISPDDWITGAVGDCGGLSPFGYQSALAYSRGRDTMFLAMVLGNSHDVLYDICCQSRMNSIIYAAAHGGAMRDLHTVFTRTCLDEVARRVQRLPDGERPLYGDSSAIGTGTWIAFNGRYRAWERFDPADLFKNYDIDTGDIVRLWEATIDSRADWPKESRSIHAYLLPFAFDAELGPSFVDFPTLCRGCNESLAQFKAQSKPEVRSGVELSPAVLENPGVIWAATISLLARWATQQVCCDVCAVKIGLWGDEVAYITDAVTWLLQQYAAWCTAAAPVSVTTILSGFDLRADIKTDPGAMGDRDFVDC